MICARCGHFDGPHGADGCFGSEMCECEGFVKPLATPTIGVDKYEPKPWRVLGMPDDDVE